MGERKGKERKGTYIKYRGEGKREKQSRRGRNCHHLMIERFTCQRTQLEVLGEGDFFEVVYGRWGGMEIWNVNEIFVDNVENENETST